MKPNDPLALERRGLAYYKSKNYEASLADLDNAVSQNPTSVKALNQRADTLVAMNQLERAAADLEAVLKLKPDDFSAEIACRTFDRKVWRSRRRPQSPPPLRQHPRQSRNSEASHSHEHFCGAWDRLLRDSWIIVIFIAKATATAAARTNGSQNRDMQPPNRVNFAENTGPGPTSPPIPPFKVSLKNRKKTLSHPLRSFIPHRQT